MVKTAFGLYQTVVEPISFGKSFWRLVYMITPENKSFYLTIGNFIQSVSLKSSNTSFSISD
jgi:hypothetical protein